MRKIFTQLCRHRVTCSLLLLLATGFFEAAASNIQVSNVKVQTVQSTNVSPTAHTIVSFTVAWENSWRVSTGPANWDAAWVFMKFRIGATDPSFTGVSLTHGSATVTLPSVGNLRVGMPVRVVSGGSTLPAGTVISAINTSTNVVTLSSNATNSATNNTLEFMRIWEHAWLSTDNAHHTVNNGGSVEVGATNISVTPRGMGAFIYRSANGSGNVSYDVTLQWNFGAQAGQGTVDVRVYAIEMVYVPQGSFFVGSGGTDGSSLTQANSTSGNTVPFQITANPPTIQANNTGSSASNLSARSGSPSMDLLSTGTSTATLATGFPTGFNAFYCMKYEITQAQYRDFLNALTYLQQVQRTAFAPNSGAGTGALVSPNANRNGIDIETPGNLTTFVPALYGCNLNGNTVYNEPDDGEWIACNFLSWMDGAAYLDWTGLRPMTELEYEKACRGNLTPVPNEFAWGTNGIHATSYAALSNPGTANELPNAPSTTSGNAVYSPTANVSGILGPLRVGILATGINNRITAGATYYGIMEMSGNLRERAVMIGNVAGRSYTGMHGDGNLMSNGHANVDFWPGINGNTTVSTPSSAFGTVGVTGAAGSGFRGGSFFSASNLLNLSSRDGTNDATRNNEFGFRGVRTAQ